MFEHHMPLIPSVGIMFATSFILAYFINETLPIKKNVTNNMHKFYMSLAMAFQMALIELLMHYYYMGTFNIYLLIILIMGVVYTVHKLYTLNFLDEKQLLLAMIEHHENAIAMVDAHYKYYPAGNPLFNEFINNIKSVQEREIQYMYKLLRN